MFHFHLSMKLWLKYCYELWILVCGYETDLAWNESSVTIMGWWDVGYGDNICFWQK